MCPRPHNSRGRLPRRIVQEAEDGPASAFAPVVLIGEERLAGEGRGVFNFEADGEGAEDALAEGVTLGGEGADEGEVGT